MKLGSGIADITKMIDKKINVSLGTDGVASNNNLNILEEAKAGSYLQKVNNLDASLIDTRELLKMLTINGAKALNLDNIGRLKKDFIADLVLINTKDDSYYYPHHNNLSNLLYSSTSNNADTVIIDGNIIYEDGDFRNIDKMEVFKEVDRRAKELSWFICL